MQSDLYTSIYSKNTGCGFSSQRASLHRSLKINVQASHDAARLRRTRLTLKRPRRSHDGTDVERTTLRDLARRGATPQVATDS